MILDCSILIILPFGYLDDPMIYLQNFPYFCFILNFNHVGFFLFNINYQHQFHILLHVFNFSNYEPLNPLKRTHKIYHNPIYLNLDLLSFQYYH